MSREIHSPLSPQITMSALAAKTAANYAIAVNYYEARLKNFLTLLDNRVKIMEDGNTPSKYQKDFAENYKQAMSQYLYTGWRSILWEIQNVIEGKPVNINNKILMKFDKAGAEGVDEYIDFLKQKGTVLGDEGDPRLTPGVINYIEVWRRQTQGKFNTGWWPALFKEYKNIDFGFENTITPIVLGMFMSNYQDIYSMVTGDIYAKSAVVQGAKPIRPDILVTGIKVDKEQLKKTPIYKKADIELSTLIDLDKIKDAAENDILRTYLDKNLDIFGFSNKSWGLESGLFKNGNTHNAKAFSLSSVLTESANKMFIEGLQKDFKKKQNGDAADKDPHRHYWTPAYASMYIVYYLSKYLFNIISPTQIGFFLSDGVFWFKDFLQMCYFFMYVAADTDEGAIATYLSERTKKNMAEMPQQYSLNDFIQLGTTNKINKMDLSMINFYPTISKSNPHIYIGVHDQSQRQLIDKNNRKQVLTERFSNLAASSYFNSKRDEKGKIIQEDGKAVVAETVFRPVTLKITNVTKV